MKDNVLIRLFWGLFPSLVVFVTYILTKDLLIQIISLLFTYLFLGLLFDAVVKPLNWDRLHGKELSNWPKKSLLAIMWLLIGFTITFLLWLLCFWPSILIDITVEITPFPYMTDQVAQWLYFVLVMIGHCIIEPVAEEFFYRSIVGDGKDNPSALNNAVSAFTYGLLYFCKYYFVFRETTKVSVWIGILSLIVGSIQNVLVKNGLISSCSFNIGISLNYPLRLAWIANALTNVSNPRLYLGFDSENLWA